MVGRDVAGGRGTVLVVGAGVNGLTCALELRRRGIGVTVLAENLAPRVTSVVAGALWEWPPAVCGYHQDDAALARAKGWCLTSYERFQALARDPSTGVDLRTVTFYFPKPVGDDPRQLAKMNELRDKVPGFVHDPGLIGANGVNPDLGLRDAYAHPAPVVDTDAYMTWLLARARDSGCRVVSRRVSGCLREQEGALRDEFGAFALVNCAGLGARELTGDAMFPLRGALVRVKNDGRAMPRVTQAHCVSQGADDRIGMIFIVPRGRDRLLLGGLTEPDEWGLDVGLDNHEPVRRMYRRCVDFLPILAAAELDDAEPVRVGLRPFRKRSVRLEHEPGTRTVHNYGHGGSGVTLSWGCAGEVADAVEALADSGR